MKTKIRKHGTKVFEASTGLDRIEACRVIKEEKQYAVINGKMVDGFTASAIVNVFDALNEENKTKFLDFSLEKMALIAFKLIK